MTADLVEALKRLLSRDPGVVARAYVFGSRARGTEGARSDVDLAVEFAPGADRGKVARLLLDLAEPDFTLLKIDVVDLASLEEGEFRRRILSEGQRILP